MHQGEGLTRRAGNDKVWTGFGHVSGEAFDGDGHDCSGEAPRTTAAVSSGGEGENEEGVRERARAGRGRGLGVGFYRGEVRESRGRRGCFMAAMNGVGFFHGE
jgi:hypothetical protein